MTALGRTLWSFAGGFMPLCGTGPEPEFTSRDQLALLNTGGVTACVCVWCYFESRTPEGPYRLEVPPHRVRKVRFNELNDPTALPLATPYAALIVSDLPIVVQVTRVDTRQAALATMGGLAHPG
jgi:hypothetical protein